MDGLEVSERRVTKGLKNFEKKVNVIKSEKKEPKVKVIHPSIHPSTCGIGSFSYLLEGQLKSMVKQVKESDKEGKEKDNREGWDEEWS